jgi:hypothetical protein
MKKWIPKSSPVKIGTMVTTKMVPPVSPPAASAASVVVEVRGERPSVTAAVAAEAAVGLGTTRVVLNRYKENQRGRQDIGLPNIYVFFHLRG